MSRHCDPRARRPEPRLRLLRGLLLQLHRGHRVRAGGGRGNRLRRASSPRSGPRTPTTSSAPSGSSPIPSCERESRRRGRLRGVPADAESAHPRGASGQSARGVEAASEPRRRHELRRARTSFSAPCARPGASTRPCRPASRARVFAIFAASEVHPFADGNGRVSRALLNAELSAEGQCRVVIPLCFRADYLGALRATEPPGQSRARCCEAIERAQRWASLVDWSMRERLPRNSRRPTPWSRPTKPRNGA